MFSFYSQSRTSENGRLGLEIEGPGVSQYLNSWKRKKEKRVGVIYVLCS